MTQLHFPLSAKYLLMGDFLGPNEAVWEASLDRLSKYNYNQILSAHKEVYAPFESRSYRRKSTGSSRKSRLA